MKKRNKQDKTKGSRVSNRGLQYLECEVVHVLQELGRRFERVRLVVVAVRGRLQVHRVVVDVVRILQVRGQLLPDQRVGRRKRRLVRHLLVQRRLRLRRLLRLLNRLILGMAGRCRRLDQPARR